MSALLGSPRELLGSPLELLGSPQELLATIRQLAPLKWLVNRFNRHSRATSSQLYSANTFVDLSIPQTLEARNGMDPDAFATSLGPKRSKNFMRLRSLTGTRGSPNSVSIPRAGTKAKW